MWVSVTTYEPALAFGADDLLAHDEHLHAVLHVPSLLQQDIPQLALLAVVAVRLLKASDDLVSAHDVASAHLLAVWAEWSA